MFSKDFDFKAFRQDVEEALGDVARKYEVNIKGGRIKYDDVSFDMTLLVTERVEGDVDGGKAEWDYHCRAYGLKPEDYGKVIMIDGEPSKLVGISSSSRKYTIVSIRLRTGQYQRSTAMFVREQLEKLENS